MARRHALVSLRHALVSLRHAAPSQRHAAFFFLALTSIMFILCQDWLIDVLRRGVASAAGAVSRQHYTGCVGRRTTRRVLVDTAGQSAT